MISVSINVEMRKAETRKAVQQAITGGRRISKGCNASPLGRCALKVKAEAIRSMKKGGRSVGPRGGKVRTPSPPGTPPHTQENNLRGSIRIGPTESGTYLVGPTTTAWYGRIHEQINKEVAPGMVTEFGGRRFPQRPFMRPALWKVSKEFPNEFRDLPLANTPAGRALNRKK